MTTGNGYTTVKLGWTDPRTGVFGAHPLLGGPLDLNGENDGVTFTLVSPDGLELSAPEKTLVPTGNVRTQGERITRAIYRRNRSAVLRVILGPAANYASFIASVRTLVRWLDAPPAVPLCVQWQPPSATQPVYLDVVGAAHAVPADERDWLRLQVEPLELLLLVRPGLRGDRVTLSNLVSNPGFEAGSGPGVSVWNDPLATLNGYSASGGALTQDVTTYSDVVLADSPLRYYRLDESAGPTINDLSPSAQNATGFPGITFLQSGALAGSTDTAAAFNGTTGLCHPAHDGAAHRQCRVEPGSVVQDDGGGRRRCSSTWAPTPARRMRNSIWTRPGMSRWTCGPRASPHRAPTTLGRGITRWGRGMARTRASMWMGRRWRPARRWGRTTSATAQARSSRRRAAVAASTSPARSTRWRSTAQRSRRRGSRRTTPPGHVAPSAAANTLSVPAGASASFGSPAWGAINQWQVRFRYRSGMTAFLSAHAPSSGNSLGAEIVGNTLYLQQTVAGTQHLLGSAAFTTIHEAWYWLVFTQFPSAPGTPCDVQATLSRDTNGAIGAQIASVGPVATYDAGTALQRAGAVQHVGGGAGRGRGLRQRPHAVAVRPRRLEDANGSASGSPTGLTALAWEQSTANTYGGGAVTSFGAARMDLPPAGTVNAAWESYSGGSPAGVSSAIPTAPGQTMAASAYVRSTGLSNTASLSLQVREWDASGNLLRATTLQTLSGNQAAWTALSGSLTIGATTAYCSIAAPGQRRHGRRQRMWRGLVGQHAVLERHDDRADARRSMPYCELRFPQSPAQLLLTGLQGDLPAPAALAWGTYLASWGLGATLSYALGRRGQSSANGRLAGASHGFYGSALSPTATAILDASSYGGSYPTVTMNPSWNPRAFSFAPADLLGVYHLFSRGWTNQSAGNLGNVQTRVETQQKVEPVVWHAGGRDQLGAYYGPFVAPISAASTWTPADSGQVNVPALPVGALTDLTQNYLTPRPQWGDLTAGGSTGRCNWQLLLPIDGSLLVGVVNNPANAPFAVTRVAVGVSRWAGAQPGGGGRRGQRDVLAGGRAHTQPGARGWRAGDAGDRGDQPEQRGGRLPDAGPHAERGGGERGGERLGRHSGGWRGREPTGGVCGGQRGGGAAAARRGDIQPAVSLSPLSAR